MAERKGERNTLFCLFFRSTEAAAAKVEIEMEIGMEIARPSGQSAKKFV